MRNGIFHDACLEQPVDVRVFAGMALQAFNEHDGGNDGRPQPVDAERLDECERLCGSLCEFTQATAIENQHASAGFGEGVVANSPNDRFGASAVAVGRLSDFDGELRKVVVGRVECVSSFELGPDGDLQ